MDQSKRQINICQVLNVLFHLAIIMQKVIIALLSKLKSNLLMLKTLKRLIVLLLFRFNNNLFWKNVARSHVFFFPTFILFYNPL